MLLIRSFVSCQWYEISHANFKTYNLVICHRLNIALFGYVRYNFLSDRYQIFTIFTIPISTSNS